MRPIEPLPLNHSWPLYEWREHLAPLTLDRDILRSDAALAERGIGLWHCDLATEKLSWTAGVFDIFGLERNSQITRAHSLSFYTPDSREAMERLRAYAIRYRRGFTLDVDIDRTTCGRCTMRLIAAPLIVEGVMIGLRGAKQRLPEGAAAICYDFQSASGATTR
ncbi:hypothetical protein SAMN02927924_01852 [Sphingobium faniae]|nr:hypothetical protein SAMN02927924_01852 [Sphingobium faniae]